MVQYTVAEIARAIGAEVQGDSNLKISGIAPLDTAKAGQASFLDNKRYRKFLDDTEASAVILSPADAARFKGAAIVINNPYLGLAKALRLFHPEEKVNGGIHPSSVVGEGCLIAASVSVGPQCVIGNNVTLAEGVIIGPGCIIGNDCHIDKHTYFHARVTLYSNVQIGKRCIVHSGVVIGADGFGFAQSSYGWQKVPQVGGVTIGNEVEIGANTTIDRGALSNTEIHDGVKLDNQIQIGHNVKIGEQTIIAGCVGIAGSTTIGKNCMIGGAACIVGHIEIGDGVIVAGMTGISKTTKEPGIYVSCLQPDRHENWRKTLIHFKRMGEYAERIEKLEAQLIKSDSHAIAVNSESHETTD